MENIEPSVSDAPVVDDGHGGVSTDPDHAGNEGYIDRANLAGRMHGLIELDPDPATIESKSDTGEVAENLATEPDGAGAYGDRDRDSGHHKTSSEDGHDSPQGREEAVAVKDGHDQRAHPGQREADDPLFPPALDESIEHAWEAGNPYDRYEVDATILKAHMGIDSIENGSRRDWSDEEDRAAYEAKRLLDARYDELMVRQEDDMSKARDRVSAGDKIARVYDEWETHYFLPRTEPVDVSEYDEWVAARVQYGDESTLSFSYRGEAAEKSKQEFCRALGPLELVPMFGSQSRQLIVPPGVEVTGDGGHTEVYRWDNLSQSGPFDFTGRDTVNVFSSTQRLLEARGLLPPSGNLDEQELKLRSSQSSPDQ